MRKGKNLVHHQLVGIIKMKNILLIVFSISTAAFYSSAYSQNVESEQLKIVDMKCYTEVIGGDFMIHRNYEVPIEQLRDYPSVVMQLNMLTRKNNRSKVIYKVIECRRMHEVFTNKDAAKLDRTENNQG